MKSAASCFVLCVVASVNALVVASFHFHRLQHTSHARPPASTHRKSSPWHREPRLYAARDSSSSRQQQQQQQQTRTNAKNKTPEVSRFLAEFRTAGGTPVDPYKVLKLPRTASSMEIKQSYRKLSRKWHPDAVARKDILPGNCANQEDVREEWEKVKLSYEILSDRKTRLKYDRNSLVADPGAAVGRAVGGAVGTVFSWGVESVFRMIAGEKGDANTVNDNGAAGAGAGGGSRDTVET